MATLANSARHSAYPIGIVTVSDRASAGVYEDLSGPAIRLVGRGFIRFDGVISLEFYSRLPRNQLSIPIVRDVVGLMSQNIIGVNVSGHIKDPNVETRTVPELDDALRQFLGVRLLVPSRTGQGSPADRR